MAKYQRLQLEDTGDITVVRFVEHRYIDGMEIEKLGEELYRLLEGGKRRKLVLDFSGVELFSSAGFGKLISLNARLKANNGTLRLCNIPPHIHDVFRICKLDRIFDVREDQADAMMAFSS